MTNDPKHPVSSINSDKPIAVRRRKPTQFEKSTGRIVLVIVGFACLYVAIMGRLAQIGIAPDAQYAAKRTAQDQLAAARPDILDRNGLVLATDIRVASLFAEPRKLIDVDEATEQLTAVIPELNAREVREKLATSKGFVWLKREITPHQQAEVYRLGLPGVGFLMENKRVYPNGPTVSHVLGSVNIDNQGIAGIEKYIDTNRGLGELQALGYAAKPAELQPMQLSLDLRAQQVMRDELMQGMATFKAKAAAGAILDVDTGEVISLVSLPDFDPNNQADALDPNRINRINVGVFEMGSTYKALTMAMAIDSGRFNTSSMFNTGPVMMVGNRVIHDSHPHGVLSLAECFTLSSNKCAAQIGLSHGADAQKAFMRKAGQLERLVTELPENAAPIIPVPWSKASTATISYGHGLAVAPLQALMAVGALMNGWHLVKPTFLKRTKEEAFAVSPMIIKPHTSDVMRFLLRLNAEKGTAKKADIAGYQVGAKTGTAEKAIAGRYVHDRLFTTFMAVFPFDKPKYVVLAVYDEPQGVTETHGLKTAAWNAGTTTGKIIERVAPLLGMAPRFEPILNLPPPLVAKNETINRVATSTP